MFNFIYVIPEYSGGGQYLFYGQLADGRYFVADTDYDRYSVSFLNKNPEDIIEDGFQEEDFTGEYLTDIYSSSRNSKLSNDELETLNFWLDMLKHIKKVKPEGNYLNADIIDFIKRLKDISGKRKYEGNNMRLNKKRTLREGTVSFICKYNPSKYSGDNISIYQDDSNKIYNATYKTVSYSDKDLNSLKKKLDKAGKEFDKQADLKITMDSKVRTSNKKSLKEDYGWTIDSSDAWDALEAFVDAYGAEYTLDNLAKAMGDIELADNLAYIFRMHDFHYGDEDYEDEDDDYDDDLDESCSKKRIKRAKK